ncbi:VUT family protein [Chromobacterium vaccinii]|uniref:VUT family protein n=1 Tax=Chromobacterium vaccinii TaxID=1108595 RepID=A0ABV0FD65_9NEIS
MFNKQTLDIAKFKEYCLIVGYFASLFSSTCFFFDAKKVELLDHVVQLPIGLIFFPLTFALCNIVQDRYGKRAANSLVATAFIFDTLLVAACTLMAWLGDRHDYWTVFKDLYSIMAATWFFLVVSSAFNIALYNYFQKKEARRIFDVLLRFFVTITATELLTSLMSMPLMFYKHGLTGSIVMTILVVVAYKVFANIAITGAYGAYHSYAK